MLLFTRFVLCAGLTIGSCWAAAPVSAAESSAEAAPGAAAWTQWGGSPARNNVSAARNLPVQWQVGKLDRKTGRWLNQESVNIRWAARLGSECYAPPAVQGAFLLATTNNDAAYLAKYPERVDLGCLLSFDRAGGKFLWQHSVEKLKAGQSVDWPKQGICGSPLVEGDRVYVVTNRGEVVCLATRGGADGESRVEWTFDMMARVGSVQRYMTSCSVTSVGRLLLVCTANGRDMKDKLPAPDAPSFLALDKRSGELAWADNSPGENILDGQWSSPAVGVFDGVCQALFAGGDGWLYSFEIAPAVGAVVADGASSAALPPRPKLLWKFDCNPKTSRWQSGGTGTRNSIVATPVVYGGRVYIVTGQDPEAGEGQADLWCIDPTKRGDVSAELAVDRQGKPLPPRRIQAVDPEAGERAVANSNSAVVWHYRGKDAGKENPDFKNVLHRSLAMPAIHNDILVLGDLAGLVHCLDAKTGEVHWTQDMLTGIWAAPLVADGKIYLGTQDGDVVVLQFGKQYKELAKNAMGAAVHASPVAVGKTLYVCTSGNVFAIEAPEAK